MPRPRSLALCLPLALLAACGDDSAEDGDGRSASGEVLEGTISDDMLPLDQLQSEPPLLEPERAPAEGGASEADEAGEADEEETAPAEDDAAEETQAEEEPQAAAE